MKHFGSNCLLLELLSCKSIVNSAYAEQQMYFSFLNLLVSPVMFHYRFILCLYSKGYKERPVDLSRLGMLHKKDGAPTRV